PLASERGDRDGARRNLALHVERSSPPDLSIPQLAAEGVSRPLGGIGENDIRVREEQQRRTVAATGDAGEEIRPLRNPGVQLAIDTTRLEVGTQKLGGTRLVSRWIGRVDADELLEELSHLDPQRLRDAGHQPSSSSFERAVNSFRARQS